MKTFTTPTGETLYEHPKGLRPVYTTTHQGSSIGYFHRWIEKVSGNTKEVGLHAILERKDGKVDLLDMSYNGLQFLDMDNESN